MADTVEAGDPEYNKWIEHFTLYDREFQKWEKRAQNILKIYRRETSGITKATPSKFNILWSNVQTLLPAVFSRIPQADVSRRFKDNDPVARVASELMERALNFEIEQYPDFRTTMTQCVVDRFLGGRGTAWVRYEPHFHYVDAPPTGFEVTSDTDEPEQIEVLKYECAPVDYVHWRDFGCTVGRTWEEVTAVWRKVYMTEEACVERFGEELGKKIPMDSKPPDLRTNRPYGSDSMDARGLIYEVWDRESQKALWISKSLGNIVDEREDPLGLPDFFPCPRPLLATTTTDSLVPIPDYVLYEDQARSLDTLSDRIAGLIEALKVRGVYDAAVPELARLFSEGGNTDLIPVTNWAAFAEKQGLKGAIDIMDITMIGQALEQAYGAFEQIKGQVYEIIGLADIMRGVSQSEETLGAQVLKAHFGGNRLNQYQNQVAQFATDILRLKGHIIATKFSPQTILMTGDAMQLSPEDQQLIPQALQLLKDDPLRGFRVEIAADSMVQIDEETDKQSRMEFLGAVGGYLKEVSGAGVPPTIAPLLISMLEFGVRGFKIGKTLEGEIDAAMDAVRQAAANPPPQQPNPEMMKIQAQGQLQQQQMQQEMQLKQQEAQLEVWKTQQEQQAQARDTQMQMAMEEQRNRMQADNEARLQLLRQEHERQLAAVDAQMKTILAMIQRGTAIDVAEMSNQTTLNAAQIAASDAASKGQ